MFYKYFQVVLPELASIRLAAYEEGGRFLGHRVLPVVGLCPGYKHVQLRTELGLPLPLATLFLCIVVKVSIYVIIIYIKKIVYLIACLNLFIDFMTSVNGKRFLTPSAI